MCFSATASFVTAGITGTIGIASLARVTQPRQLPLAATPILFALQQTFEGLLWLDLPLAPDGWTATILSLLFLLFAQVFWPVYAPCAVLLIEPNVRRRHLMWLCFAAGVCVGTWLLWSILSGSHGAVVLACHVVYVTGQRQPAELGLAYMVATCLSPLLSSHRTVAILGAVVAIGSVVAWLFYAEAFVSVWCFFAATASVIILGHFERARRRRLTASPA
jgi:hypothetical protein